MSDMDATYMSAALELAALGRGQVEPNPMVGAVLVRDGAILGQGYHRRFGGDHAEVEAIAAARAAGHNDLAGATLYVTLEPCSHTGKTPPCTQAILGAGIPRVVAAMEDPDTRVAGSGIAQLRGAGVTVVVGVRQEQARRLLAAYIKLRTQGRPWVICKWAQSLDGKIATHRRHSKWLTGPESRQRVHIIRGHCDGVCVGAGTVASDDPLLTNRSDQGRQPARLILDEHLEMSPSCRMLSDVATAPVLVATRDDNAPALARPLTDKGAEVLRLPAGPGGIDLYVLLQELGNRQWTNLLVEGGRAVLGSFLKQRLADELKVFVAPCIVGGRESLGPVDWEDIDLIDHAHRLTAPTVESIGPDVLLTYRMGE